MPGRGEFIGRGNPSRFHRPTGLISGESTRGGFHQHGGDVPTRFVLPTSLRLEPIINQPLVHGTEGTPISVMSNFYKVENTAAMIYHYDLSIAFVQTDKPTRRPPTNPRHQEQDNLESEPNLSDEKYIQRHSKIIMALFYEQNADVFDHKTDFVSDGMRNIFSTTPFARDPVVSTVDARIDNKQKSFFIKMTLVDQMDMDVIRKFYSGQVTELPQKVLTVIDILMKNVVTRHFTCFQRKYFDCESAKTNSTGMVDFVSGFGFSARSTEFGLAMNTNLKTGCILSQKFTKLDDYVLKLVGPSPHFDGKALKKINTMLRHLKIYTTHSDKKQRLTYTIDRVVSDTARNKKFQKINTETKQMETMSISVYFKNTYNIEIKDLPLVKTTGKFAMFLPMELCYLEKNQFLSNSKTNASIQAELLKKSTVTPEVYFSKIQTNINKVNIIDQGFTQNFGVSLLAKPIQLDARILKSPEVTPAQLSDPFYEHANDEVNVVAFCFDPKVSGRTFETFMAQLKRTARDYGLQLVYKTQRVFDLTSPHQLENIFANIKDKLPDTDIVITALPDRSLIGPSEVIYSLIKHFCDQRYGIMSQCFKSKHVPRAPGGYFDNILLKINGKLGGKNSVLELRYLKSFTFDHERTMMMGLDLNHPGENEKMVASIAAAVGSIDSFFYKFSACVRVQKVHRDAIISEAGTMTVELMRNYARINRVFPDTLIIFRDGVSEGQFASVRETEIGSIREHTKHLNPDLKIIFITVLKMHSTRFCTVAARSQGRKTTHNVPSGTVVDTGIVEPHYKNFYLNSHFSPLGTSKPTKYVVLQDDLELVGDELQKLCFYACFNSVRTRQVLAIPAPIRYADLCAYRSKVHIEAQRELTILNKEEQVYSIDKAIVEKLNNWVKLHRSITNRMYYC